MPANSNIKYTVDLAVADDGKLEANRCNCTFCQKPGLTNYHPDRTSFKLLSPQSRSELGDYNPNAMNAHKYFCRTCGCHVWAEGEYPYEGQIVQFFTINLACVDQPQDGVDLSKVTLTYEDGRNNNWGVGRKDKPFPGGLP